MKRTISFIAALTVFLMISTSVSAAHYKIDYSSVVDNPVLKKIIKNDKLFRVCLFCVISGTLLVILDTQMAGILERYMSDFSWLYVFASIIVIFSIFNSNQINEKLKKIILEILIIFIILAIAYQFLYVFDDQLLHDMINSSTDFYFKWYYLLQWWL